MDLIGVILAAIAAVIGAAFSKLAADEFKAWTPRLIATVVQCAIRMLPEEQRDRYAEEWQSHIDETPGEIGKLIVGLGLLPAAWNLSRVAGDPNARDPATLHSGADTDPPADFDLYQVEKYDTLRALAKRFYGDANQYDRIISANLHKLEDPDQIYVGTSLRIPRAGRIDSPAR